MRLHVSSHAFFFDFDGTLVDIAPEPDAIAAAPGLVAALARLAEAADGAVAVVTGRPHATVDLHLRPLRLPAAGIHGLELRRSGADAPGPLGGAAMLDAARAAFAALIAADDRLLVEDKGVALAIHFRRAPDRADAIMDAVRGLAADGLLLLQRGKMVVELRLPGPDKGAALAILMEGRPFRGRSPVMFGDDLTDEAAFRAAAALGGTAVHVGPSPAPACAAHRVPGPAAVRRIIAALASDGEAALDRMAAGAPA